MSSQEWRRYTRHPSSEFCALTTLGIFHEDPEGRFRHTELSQTLHTDHPESVRAWALMLGAHFVWRPAGDLYESVRTGTPGFHRLYGQGFFEWTRTHPDDGAVFNAAMTSGSAQRLPALLSAYDFTRFERIVDVGGGHGALLAGILAVSPKPQGVLYDLHNVVTGAQALRAPEIAERCEIVGGDFFESVPAGGDAYVLSRVIHDWDDAAALKILGNCRRAIQPKGQLLLIEGVAKPPNEPDPNKFFDVWFIDGGGYERTEAEYRTLLRRGGFALVQVLPLGGSSAVLESRPD
jgi:O-methyltransferase domain